MCISFRSELLEMRSVASGADFSDVRRPFVSALRPCVGFAVFSHFIGAFVSCLRMFAHSRWRLDGIESASGAQLLLDFTHAWDVLAILACVCYCALPVYPIWHVFL